MNLCARILKWSGWTLDVTVPAYPKAIICVAPHTSNWDFILGKLAYGAVNRRAGFLMKAEWFFWPLGPIFRAIGGIPVHRGKGLDLTGQLIRRFRSEQQLVLAITPEGTRSRTAKWHTGFLRIAREADVPVILGVLDYDKKHIDVTTVFEPGPDIDEDMRRVKEFYRPYHGLHPDKFTVE